MSGLVKGFLYMTYHEFEISEEKIAGFCRENKISEFAIFGSILTGDFGLRGKITLTFNKIRKNSHKQV